MGCMEAPATLRAVPKSAEIEVVHPHSTRLFVREESEPSVTPGGLHIAPSATKNLEVRTGIVVAVGPGWRSDESDGHRPLPWKAGDRIKFYVGRFACKIKVNHEELTALDEMDVLCRIETQPA